MDIKRYVKMIKCQFNYIKFRYLDLTIKVGSCNKNDIIWLKEFLCPYLKPTDSSFCDCEIHLILDDKYFNSLLQKSPQSKIKISGFILDKKIVKLITWESSKNCQILFDDEFNVFYLVSHEKKQVTVLAHHTKSIGFRTALMRVITEYAMNYSRTHGGFFIHSSAFAYNGKGIMIAGPENCGKTSLLIYFLQNLPSRFISNDRVLVFFDEASPVIYGMPTVITVSEDSLQMFPLLKINLLRYNFHHRYTIDEILERKCRPYTLEQGEYTFSARQFSHLLETRSSSDSQLSAILFPHISKQSGSMSLESLPSAAVLERLEEARFAKRLTEWQSFFYLNPNHDSSPGVSGYEEFAYKVANQIPCFDCYLGFRNYEGNEAQQVIRKVFKEGLEKF